MKTLHQFLENLLIKIIRGSFLLPLLFIISFHANSQGILTSFDNIIQTHQQNYQTLLKSYRNQNFNLKEIENSSEITIDQEYLFYILQVSPGRYVSVLGKDKCKIHDLILSDLLLSPQGRIENIVLNYKDKKNTLKKVLLKREVYLNKIVKRICPKVLDMPKYFTSKTLKKTSESINPIPPKSMPQCQEIIKSYRNDVKTPYFCKIYEDIKKIKRKKITAKNIRISDRKEYSKLISEISATTTLAKILGRQKIQFLENICQNLDNHKKFCKTYLNRSFWTDKNLTSDEEKITKTFCPQSNKQKFQECLQELTDFPELCHQKLKEYPSLTPKPNCKDIAGGILHSRLQLTQADCPGRSLNDSMTTASRILNHFYPKEYEVNSSCDAPIIYPVLKFNEEFLEYENWKIELCYENKILKKEICHPTFYGEVKDSKLSLTNVVAEFLSKTKGFNKNNQQCSIVTEKEYTPSLLKFKSGCHIIFKEGCNSGHCSFKVILDEIEIKNYKLKKDIDFELIPQRYTDENKTFLKALENYKKIKKKEIKNISSYLRSYESHKDAIFVGIGCAQRLYPTFFSQDQINDCDPLSFIIDGHIENKGYYSMRIKSSIDHNYASKIIPWNNVFNSVLDYQKTQPINKWSFYALY